MDSQDKFFKESIKQIHEKRDAKEENFEMLQQQERAKAIDLRKRYVCIQNLQNSSCVSGATQE